ncbi:MAG: hypothetical protein ACTHYV_06550 [Psychroflexus sp.]|uniref:hypothetical protein n=1 Tax=Psychroflexus sp. S27 TaxID=1982757 RepID=UPI000C29DAD6|nr:hypothetical protein [Psychroflexus sp. S27]PJX25130.1 hypothetical protein CAP47_02175 [Psychroflexus sp. S27]
MKKKIRNIAILSSALTTVGFLMDGDIKEPSMLMRFTEFFGMFIILFILIAPIYFFGQFLFKRMRADKVSS